MIKQKIDEKELEWLVKIVKESEDYNVFLKKQKKMYRWQEDNEKLNYNNINSNTQIVGNAYYFITNKEIALKYGNYIVEIPYLNSDIISYEEIEDITKLAQKELAKLVSQWIYEWDEYEKYESLLIGRYPNIARIYNKPFIKTWLYNDTEVLYFPEFDKTQEKLSEIRNKFKK